MSANMTDAEVWLEIAEHMRGSGVLPTYDDLDSYGLCNCLFSAKCAGIIDRDQEIRMESQLKNKFGGGYRPGAFFWKESITKPRIRACETLARESMKCKP